MKKGNGFYGNHYTVTFGQLLNSYKNLLSCWLYCVSTTPMDLALTKKSWLKFNTTIISSQLAGTVVNSGLSQSEFKTFFCHLPNLWFCYQWWDCIHISNYKMFFIPWLLYNKNIRPVAWFYSWWTIPSLILIQKCLLGWCLKFKKAFPQMEKHFQ